MRTLSVVLIVTACLMLMSGCATTPPGPTPEPSPQQTPSGDAPVKTVAKASGPDERSLIDLDQPRPNDKQQRRVITLDNGLQALLISDPEAQKSAAALDVAVGSLEDPPEFLGMAHFLEHMLFLGTEKYPDVDGYSEYLRKHQGGSNAYTAAENTNYFFEVNHDAFEGALDRFSQFFVAPLFDPKFVEREMNAVNSEHQKNLQNDYWRTRMIKRMLHRDGHPRQKFSTGNLDTLQKISREDLLKFYRTYYSANVMKLVVLSTVDLDTQEQWVRARFSAVPNHNRGELSYPEDVYDAKQLPQQINVKPVKELTQVELAFAMPPTLEHFEAKPAMIMASLVGHESEGSLLSLLKRENLATALSAGPQSDSYATYLRVTITLTDVGYRELDRVVGLFFAYMNMLRARGLEEYYYTELKNLGDLDYFFMPHQEGGNIASAYASAMQHYDAEKFEKQQYLYRRYDPTLFKQYLDTIIPERLRLVLLAPDVATDKTETFYGSSYSVKKIEPARVEAWKKVAAHPDLSYPPPNPFMPDNLDILADDTQSGPYKLIDDERGVVWFEQDKVFKLPKAQVSILLQSDQLNTSPRRWLVTRLFERVLNERLNEWSYTAREAGLEVFVTAELSGIRLTFRGYSQRIPDLIRAVGPRFRDATIDPGRFDALKVALRRELFNFEREQAYSQAFYDLRGMLFNPAMHLTRYRDMVDEVTVEDVQKLAQEILREGALEGLAYGNLDGPTLKSAIDELFSTIVSKPLPAERRLRRTMVDLPEGQRFANVIASKTNNHAWVEYVEFGALDPKLEGIIRVGASALEAGFYGEMRTRQQLGYIVFSGPSLNSEALGMFFLIQSGTNTAIDVAGRAETWLKDAAMPSLSALSEAQFEALKQAVITELEREEKNIGERMSTLSFEAIDLEGRFNYRQEVVEALKKLTKQELLDAYTAAFDASKRSGAAVYLDAEGAEASKPAATLVEDAEAFKAKQAFFK